MERKRFIRKFISVFLSLSLVLSLLAASKLTVLAGSSGGNEPPILTLKTLTGAKEDTPLIFSYSDLVQNLSDPDGNPASVIIHSIDSGSLWSEGQRLNANDRLPYGQLTWIPEPNRNGSTLAFKLKAYDDEDYSDPIQVIINVLSVNNLFTGTLKVTGNPVVGQTLTADTSEIADADGLGTFTYQWVVREDPMYMHIPSATNSTYTITPDMEGKYIKLDVRYVDGGGRTEFPSSAEILCQAAPTGNTSELEALKTAIESYHSGEGGFDAEINEDNRTITVTGRVTFASSSLLLDIPEDVTVIWDAEILADDEYDLKMIRISGNGRFEVSPEGVINVTQGIGIYAESDISSITVSGGMVNSGSGFGIFANGSTEIDVQSGKVNGGERGINTLGTNSVINVSGGLITSDGSPAIRANGSHATVTLSGGTLIARTDSAMNVVNIGNPSGLDISGDTAVIAWNNSAGKRAYTAGTKEHLDHIPEDMSVVWAENNDAYGITYESGNNRGFYYVKGVTVNSPLTVASIYTGSLPNKSTYYVGDTLDLSGLTVTLTMSDGSIESVPFKDFQANNITTNPSNGSVLAKSDSDITITHTPTKKSDILSLTIKYAYSITVTNDGHGTGSASSSKAPIGTDITLTATPNPGYHFVEWQVISGGITITDNTFSMSDDPVTVRAIFEEDEAEDYTVTFMDSYGIYAVKTVPAGECLSSDDFPAIPKMTDYLFTGWYFGPFSSGGHFTSTHAVNEDLTVYAGWFLNVIILPPGPGGNDGGNNGGDNGGGNTAHTITVENNGNGIAGSVPVSAVSGAAVTLHSYPSQGFYLERWEVISPSDLVITDNTFTMPDTPVTVRALFAMDDAVNHTVTFMNGTEVYAVRSVAEGGSIGVIDWPAAPSKTGSSFIGWYLSDNGGTYFNSNYTVNADLTVYAKWLGIFPPFPGGDNGGDNGGNNGGNNGDNTPGITPGTTATGTETITVDVKQGNTDTIASQIAIERTTKADGQKSDTVTYQKEKAVETVNKLKAEGKDTARIVIPDEKDVVSETRVNIPTEVIETLSNGGINLQIDTEEAKINLSSNTLSKISQASDKDLYFHLVPVKDETQKETVKKQARLEAAVVSSNKNTSVTVIGNPITIETNMPSSEADITLPLTGIKIPADTKKKAAFLKQLAVYIEHSDGEKELVQGKLVEYKEGVYGIRFRITKFSIFTVVKTDAFTKSAACDITKVTTPLKAVIKGKNITATVASGISSLTVKAVASEKASWMLYLDKACTKEVKGNKLKLKTGLNTSYIKVTAEDKSTKIYKMTITRDKKIIKKSAEQYKSHIRLGLIGNEEYAKKVAKIFEQEYSTANVMLKKDGKFYLVTIDFKDKVAAKKACEDMISRQYIVNYYFE